MNEFVSLWIQDDFWIFPIIIFYFWIKVLPKDSLININNPLMLKLMKI